MARSTAPAAPRAGWAEPAAPVRLVVDTATIVRTELLKIRHDPVEMATRVVQPLLWLLVFGQVLAQTRAIPTGSLPYLDYLAPGILAQSAQFSAIFYGLSVIRERDLGVIHKLLASPASRVALVLGKGLAGGFRAIVQAVIVYLASVAIGVHVNTDPVAIVAVAVVVMLGSAVFASFSLIIASLVRSQERFMGIGQILSMPLFFASSAIYPISLMPDWLKVVAQLNPLTYMVDALRALMLAEPPAGRGVLIDISVLVATLVVLVAIGSRTYARLAE